MSLGIEHTEAEGTLLHGTTRGDGAGEVVKALGWRWGRSIGSWYLPRSRDVPPKRPLIETTARRLREAGHEVQVSIEATVGDRAEREQRIARRSQDRAERLESRAGREQDRAGQRHDAFHQIADHIPPGQPILTGHRSQARAERDVRRMAAHLDAGAEHQRRADDARGAAHAARDHQARRHHPVTVANRIERLAADVRRLERTLAGLDAHGVPDDDAHRQSVQDRLASDRADLEHWRSVRADQIATGQARDYGRDSVAVGDLVKIRGHWHKVARANPRTVAVETGHSWTDKAPWHEVQDHRPSEPEGGAATVDDPPAGPASGTPDRVPGRPTGAESGARGLEHQRRELPTDPDSPAVDR